MTWTCLITNSDGWHPVRMGFTTSLTRVPAMLWLFFCLPIFLPSSSFRSEHWPIGRRFKPGQLGEQQTVRHNFAENMIVFLNLRVKRCFIILKWSRMILNNYKIWKCLFVLIHRKFILFFFKYEALIFIQWMSWILRIPISWIQFSV